MPIPQETIRPRLVEPVFDEAGKLKGLQASTYFVVQSKASWESKRNFIADRAVEERAAELSFGGRIFYGWAETYHQMKAKDLLEKRARGKAIKQQKSAAFARAVESIDKLVEEEEVESGFIALDRNIRGESARDNIFELEESELSSEQAGLVAKAKLLVSDYSLGVINGEDLRKETEDLVCELAESFDHILDMGKIGTDLVQVAEDARSVYEEHKVRLEKIDFDLEITLGNVDGGLQTKSKRSLIDKMVDTSQSHPALGVIFNPTVVGVGASMGAWAAKVPIKCVPVIGGFAGAVFAGARRWSKEKKDRFLKMREAEVGYEISLTNHPRGKLEAVSARVLGRTDFREYAYDLKSANEIREELNDYVDRGVLSSIPDSLPEEFKEQAESRRANLVKLVAEVKARIDIADEKGVATLKFGSEGDGIFNINRERFELVAAAAAAFTKLEKAIGVNEAEELLDLEYTSKKREIMKDIFNKDERFEANRKRMAARSAAVGIATGLVGGLGIHLAGEAGERVVEKASDIVSKVKVRQDIPLADGGPLGMVYKGDKGSRGLAVQIPRDYKYVLDTNSISHKLVLDGQGGHFQIPVGQNMSVDDMNHALADAGLTGKVSVYIETITDPARTITSTTATGVLNPDFLRNHNLGEIKFKDYDLSFAKGRSLTLHQDGTGDWRIAPLAGVREENLVAFYQVRDAQGNFHTVLADTTNGRFTIPSEFINPATGKVDQVSVIGYGTAYDFNGNIIDANKVVANPDLIRGGRLESMASVAFDQKERPIEVTTKTIVAGETYKIANVKVEDLAKITQVEQNHDYDVNLPFILTPVAPRMFPGAAGRPMGFSYLTDQDNAEDPDGGDGEIFPIGTGTRPMDIFAMAREDEERSKKEAAIIAAQIKEEEEKDEEETSELVIEPQIIKSSNVIGEINQGLRNASEKKAAFALGGNVLNSYIRLMRLPMTAKVQESYVEVVDGRMHIAGFIKAALGNSVSFDVNLINHPMGGIAVESHQMELKGGMIKGKRAEVESKILNLNRVIADEIASQVNKNWRVDDMKIGEDSLILTFANNSTLSDSPAEVESRAQTRAERTKSFISEVRATKKSFKEWAKDFSRKQAILDTQESLRNAEGRIYIADLRDPVIVRFSQFFRLNWYLMRHRDLTEDEFEKLLEEFKIEINTVESVRSAYFGRRTKLAHK